MRMKEDDMLNELQSPVIKVQIRVEGEYVLGIDLFPNTTYVNNVSSMKNYIVYTPISRHFFLCV